MIVAANYHGKTVLMGGLRLSDALQSGTTDYAEIIVGDGAPSGGYGRDSGATLLYLRKDASSAATALYVSADGGTTWAQVLLAALDGNSLILDADGDTWISASTDDQITIRIGGADDFQIVANVFRSLAGSSIATDTITETSAGVGVTVDGLVIRDGIAHGSTIADPGSGGAIAVTRSGSCALATSAPETRSLANPTAVHQTISLYLATDGGDCTVTVAAAFNAAGNTSITLNDAGDSITLIGVSTGAGLRWRMLAVDGCSLA